MRTPEIGKISLQAIAAQAFFDAAIPLAAFSVLVPNLGGYAEAMAIYDTSVRAIPGSSLIEFRIGKISNS